MSKSQKMKDFELVADVIRDQLDNDAIQYNSRMLFELTDTYLCDIQDSSHPVRRDVENWAKHTTLLEETAQQYLEDSMDNFPKTKAVQVLTHNFLQDALKDKEFCAKFEDDKDNYPTVAVATMGLLNDTVLYDYMDKKHINATQMFNDNIKEIKDSVNSLTKSFTPWIEASCPNCFAMAMNLPYDKKECLGELASYQYLETSIDYLRTHGAKEPMSYQQEWKSVVKQIEKEMPNEFKKSVHRFKGKTKSNVNVNER